MFAHRVLRSSRIVHAAPSFLIIRNLRVNTFGRNNQLYFTPVETPPKEDNLALVLYDAKLIAMVKQQRAFQDRKGSHKRRKVNGKGPSSKWELPDPLQGEVERLLKRPRPQPEKPVSIFGPADGDAVDRSVDEAQLKNNGIFEDNSDFHEVELVIEELSSGGEGLARATNINHIYVIPFTIPGERVLARVRRKPNDFFGPSSLGDLVEVLEPSALRSGVTPQCKYFGTCSGCQLQMLPYEEQLSQKRKTVESAFRHFSGLQPDQIPEVASTGPSPLRYGYRTKLTPHFDRPPKQDGSRRWFTEPPAIGFNKKGQTKVLDIETCPIGTEILQEGFKQERTNIYKNLSKYKSGSTILLRESTKRTSKTDAEVRSTHRDPLAELPTPSTKTLTQHTSGPAMEITYPDLPFQDTKTYETDDGGAIITEYIGTYKFTTRAGSFFQNNNSILPSFLSYVRSQANPTASTNPTVPPSTDSDVDVKTKPPQPPLKYLLDAYSGSGLFALTLSSQFSSVLGIEIDTQAVTHARLNADANNITNAGFIAADASDLFAGVPYPPEQTVVVIDPPRKGCSQGFLRQLLAFGARRVVYVSCNVNSQARDVGVMVSGGFEGEEEEGGWRYEIESLKGWDFFPQTGHVEGVCVLNRVEKEKKVEG